MSHFNHAANTWDSEEKIKLMGDLAIKTRERLILKNKVDLLDVGCGTGLFSLEFIDQAKSITGIDTSEGMLAVFESKVANFDNIKSINIDLEKEDLAMTFDLIISSMVFHHLDHPEKMLMRLSSMLNIGGQIAIVDLETEDGSFHPRPVEMGVKHFGFSNEEIQSWSKSVGLSVEVSTISQKINNGKSYAQFLAVFTR